MKIESEVVLLPGVVGQIETTIDKPSQQRQGYVAVCCHPHPLHGGTMGNKVVYTASRSFAGLGILSFRFNFRGVGESEGAYAEGQGEQQDLVAVVNWVQRELPECKLLLAGFSFGAYISAMQAKSLSADMLVSIAPPIGRIEYKGFAPPNCPWLVVQGDEDELVDADQVEDWVNGLDQSPELHRLPETTHFFHRKLVNLRRIVEQFTIKSLEL